MVELSKFVDGFWRFSHRYFEQDRALYEKLSQGQSPKVMMIACSDSRVDPAIITDCEPGDLFTVRNVANLVPPCDADGHHHGTSAAIEFAVHKLDLEHIVVMGHSHCAGIHALMHGVGCEHKPMQFVNQWVSIAASAREKVLTQFAHRSAEEQILLCEEEAILVSLKNLMSFPWIRERVEAGTLTIHGWYFNLEAGELLAYNPETANFELLLERT